ncbi:unnamed protein product [Calicophoron daubneyi]|uniref:BHLH domain-containing protein n=1 Tax=Calicophoron daubneyi TaxID=300641 RepID=A0AAV2U0A5_CALDB
MFSTSGDFRPQDYIPPIYSCQPIQPPCCYPSSANIIPPATTQHTTQSANCFTPFVQHPLKPANGGRRGRRSAIPIEQREQCRRLKKQNMERRRRACISDKMNALHNLAMNIIGMDPNTNPKVEKADILRTCYSVLEGVTKIAKEEPELRSRLYQLRSKIIESASSTKPVTEDTWASESEKENVPVMTPSSSTYSSSQKLPIKLLRRQGVWQSTPVSHHPLKSIQNSTDLPDSGIQTTFDTSISHKPDMSPPTSMRLTNISVLTSPSANIGAASQSSRSAYSELQVMDFRIPEKRRSIPPTRFTTPDSHAPANAEASMDSYSSQQPSVWRPYLD